MSRLVVLDNNFLNKAVTQDNAFLYLIKREDGRSINFLCVLTYDIDLIWRSHQLYPLHYCKDLTTVFGRMLDHNDCDFDATKIKTRFRQIMKLWKETFGRQYKTISSMYRSGCICECMIECATSFSA